MNDKVKCIPTNAKKYETSQKNLCECAKCACTKNRKRRMSGKNNYQLLKNTTTKNTTSIKLKINEIRLPYLKLIDY